MRFTTFLLVLCLVAVALAADPAMSGPLAGFVLDQETRSVRPVLGVPGSAYVAAAVLQNVDALAVSPDGNRALAAQAEGLAWVERLPGGDFNAVRIEGSAGADRLAWSPDGSAAAAYGADARSVQVLVNGKVSRVVDLSALDSVSSLAIDNGGDYVIAGAAGGIFLARKDGDVRLVAAVASPAALAIRGEDLFVAAGAVFEINDYAGKATLLPFAEDAAAVALQVAPGGERLIVATESAVSIFEIASRSVAAKLDLDFKPTMLHRLGAAAVFALNSGKAGVEPLYAVSASAAPAVFFVPSGREQ
jgi:hypothetical protein